MMALMTAFVLIVIFSGGIWMPVVWSYITPFYYSYHDKVSGSDITIYQVACAGAGTVSGYADTSFDNCLNPSNDGRIAYKIVPAGQYVIEWYPDENSLLNLPANTPPEYYELRPCLIIDNNNWSCNGTTVDGSYTLGFNSGKYFDNNPFSSSDIYVSAAEWEQTSKAKTPSWSDLDHNNQNKATSTINWSNLGD